MKQRVRDRRWVVVVVVTALVGAAAAAIWTDSVAPGQRDVIVSLAVAGFGLGGVVGVLASLWMRPHGEPAAEVEPPPPEREDDPPPAGGAAGWYGPEQAGGERRYWDGERWTDHVWRERAAGSRRSPRRGDRSSR